MMHDTAALAFGPSRAQSLASERFGAGCRIAGWTPLTRRAASVTRASLSGAPVESVIVKHLGQPVGAPELRADHPEFANEALAYRFLAAVGADGAVAPALIGHDPEGVLVLADLGETGSAPRRSIAELVPRLAAALARLHAVTHDGLAVYEAMRAEAGLGGRSADRRKYGTPGVRRLFGAGVALCLGTEGLTPRRMGALAEGFEAVEAAIDDPGPYRSLIHDDLSNARQTVDLGDTLFLVDFEQAKVGHVLLDFAKPMIGKFEVDETRRVWGWQCPGFPPELPTRYRELRGVTASLPDWDWHLGAALIHGAMQLLGRMAAWDPARPLHGSRRQNVRAILHRLHSLLGSGDGHGPIRDFLAAYLAAHRADEP